MGVYPGGKSSRGLDNSCKTAGGGGEIASRAAFLFFQLGLVAVRGETVYIGTRILVSPFSSRCSKTTIATG